jgi:hypothetical protein
MDMEATLKSDQYLQRLLSESKHLFTGGIGIKQQETYQLRGIKVKQDFSFLTKIIPEFVYKQYSRIGLNEMKSLFYDKVLNYTVDEIKEI